MAFDVFISYSTKDKTTADATCAALEDAGIRCWIAPRDVHAGIEYAGAIVEAIDSCRLMVLIFSSSANSSQQIQREIERAARRGIHIVPMRIDEVVPTRSIAYFLGSIQWLDALTPPLADHLAELVENVQAILRAAPPSSIVPPAGRPQAVPAAGEAAASGLQAQIANNGPREQSSNQAGVGDGRGVQSASRGSIRRTIERSLPALPLWAQAMVLYAFVLLCVYLLIFTSHASIVLPATVQVKLTLDEIKARRQQGLIVSANSYSPPKVGYMIGHDGFFYALNSDGDVHLDLSISAFVLAMIRRSMDVTVVAPDGIRSLGTLDITGFAKGSMFFEPSSDADTTRGLGAIDVPWIGDLPGAVARTAEPDLIVSRAEAAIARGGRLYVQSVTVPETLNVAAVKASLVVGKSTSPLLTLSSNLTSQESAQLIVKSGASTVQDYRTFFPLSQPSVPKDAHVAFQSAGSLFGLGYDESFDLPDKMDLGVPTELKGSAGTNIVVQLTYPVDVVFFAVQGSAALTDALVPQVRTLGYAPRINSNSTNLPGNYNIIYGGADVPVSAVRDMVRLASNAHFDLHYIQAQIKLSNGLQNQIQIGRSPKVACLPSIGAPTIAALLQAASDNEFLKLLDKLPYPNGC
jgi:hypothetical protein